MFVIYGALMVDAHEKRALVEVLDEDVVGARTSWQRMTDIATIDKLAKPILATIRSGHTV